MVITEPTVVSEWLLNAWVQNYILEICWACSTKILLHSFLEYTKIEQAKEKLCWQGA